MSTSRKSDQDIKADVAREFAWDTRVAPTVLGAIRGTPGVREVSDHLSVEAKV